MRCNLKILTQPLKILIRDHSNFTAFLIEWKILSKFTGYQFQVTTHLLLDVLDQIYRKNLYIDSF